MKKKILIWTAVMAAIMLILPLIVVKIGGEQSGAQARMMMLMAINPISAIYTGVFAGTKVRKLWILPLLLCVLFFLGAWLAFGPMFHSITLYTIIYLVIGLAAMLVSVINQAKKNKQK